MYEKNKNKEEITIIIIKLRMRVSCIKYKMNLILTNVREKS